MWNRWWSSGVLRQSFRAAFHQSRNPPLGFKHVECRSCLSNSPALSSTIPASMCRAPGIHAFSTAAGFDGNSRVTVEGENITFAEAKKLMRLVNVETLKARLGMEKKEVIGYPELLEACKNMGVARSQDEAIAFVRVLDEAGVVLLFRDKVYLHPDKVSA